MLVTATWIPSLLSQRNLSLNPNGLGGKSGKTESNIVKADNVSIDKDKPERGNSKAYTASRRSFFGFGAILGRVALLPVLCEC